MTLIAVSIFVDNPGSIPDGLERAHRAASEGARLVEWRIDQLAESDDALLSIARLVRESPMPCIITCRPKWEGGQCSLDEPTRVDLLSSILRLDEPPRYVDIELESLRRDPDLSEALSAAINASTVHWEPQSKVIASSHDFNFRPTDLMQRIEAMVYLPICDVIKVAWTARSLRDNLEAFDLLTERNKPMIALCMGSFGLMSRVLAAKFGGFLTFAGVDRDSTTAPGQPTVDELVSLYRMDRINPATKVYGVIGWPVEQSHSPAIHNAGFEAVKHNGVFLPLPIPADYVHFKATVGALIDHPRLDFAGASVTIPHKENLIRFVRETGGHVYPLCERIGAANTLIVNEDRSIECINTDCPAAIDALCAGMDIDCEELKDKRVAILGAGGAARAVAVGLLDAGANVVVFNRNIERATRLVEELNECVVNDCQGVITVGTNDALTSDGFDIIINCTPIGMMGGPLPDDSPLNVLTEKEVPLNKSITVFDTVYNPTRTKLIRDAEKQGARVVMGMDMFIRQAAMQFERWTNHPYSPPFTAGRCAN